MVVANIAMELTQTKLFADESNKFIQAFLPNILNDIAYSSKVVFARLGNLEIHEDGNTITYGVFVYDKDGKQVYAKQVDIAGFLKSMLSNHSNLYLITHSRPFNICVSSEFASTKKIYVLRDFRDAYHSHIRSVGKGEGDSKQLAELCEEEDFSICARYFDVSMFLAFLYNWKMHVEQFLENKDKYILVRYEDLIANPEKAILELANALLIDIDTSKARFIAEKYMHKDVWLFGRHTDDFKHYNEKKSNVSWRDYFSQTMKDLTREKIGHLLVKLGYESSEEWASSTLSSSNEIQFSLERIYKETLKETQKDIQLSINEYFIEAFLSSERVVFFGAGEYLELLLNRIGNPKSVIFIVDENPDKIGTDICGVSIVGIKELVYRYSEYNRICISVDDKYFDQIYQKLELIGIPRNKIVNIFFRNMYVEMKKETDSNE
jgi:hypothetical protein